MEGVSSFDLITVGFIFVSGLFAYFRGLIKEILLIVNWILAILVAYMVSPLIFDRISQIDFIMGVLGDSCELMMILSFLIGFTLALIGISFITYRISYLVEVSIFSEVNKVLGLLFGFIRGGLIIIIFLVIYNQVLKTSDTLNFIGLSKSNLITLLVQERLLDQYPKSIPDWVIRRYDDLLTNCVNKR